MAHCRAQQAVGPLQKEGSREAKGASKSCTLQGRAVGPYASDIPILGLRVARVLPGLGSPVGWGTLGARKWCFSKWSQDWSYHPSCHLGVTYGLGTSGLPSPATHSPPSCVPTHSFLNLPCSCHLLESILSSMCYSPLGTPFLNSSHL